MNAGYWIDGIQVTCQDGRLLPLRGGTGGAPADFSLQPGERILAVSGFVRGNSGNNRVYALRFHTDRRTSPLYGNGGESDQGQVPFRMDVPEGYELAGLFGNSGEFLEAIGLLVRPGGYRQAAYRQQVRLRSFNYPDQGLGMAGNLAMLQPGAPETFRVVPGLSGVGVSFESVDRPGYFLRHQNYRLMLSAADGSDLFRADATFQRRPGLADSRATSLESSNYPGYFIRHRNFEFWLDAAERGDLFAADATFTLMGP